MDEQIINKLMALQKDMEPQFDLAEQLMKADPQLNPMSAMVIAGDRISAERSWEMLEEGVPYEKAVPFVGSFARLDFAARALKGGYVDLNTILDDLPDLWRGSDPDDTNTQFLELWRLAWKRNGMKPVCDGKALPSKTYLTVYRGQDKGAPLGWAWTLDKKIAKKFANGAGTRQADRNGIVYTGTVLRKNVYGYLTLRGESECVLNPNFLSIEK